MHLLKIFSYLLKRFVGLVKKVKVGISPCSYECFYCNRYFATVIVLLNILLKMTSTAGVIPVVKVGITSP